MRYKIYKNGTHVNTIIAGLGFLIPYCEENGYTYELDERPEPKPIEPTPDPQTDTDELLVDLAYRTTLLELGLTAEEVI